MKKSIAALAFGAILLSGCSSPAETAADAAPATSAPAVQTPPAEASPTAPEGAGSSEYIFVSAYNTLGKIQLEPAPPVAELEELRGIAKADPVTYVAVKVDNRKGELLANMYSIIIHDDAGTEYELRGSGDLVDDWRTAAGDDLPTDAYNKFIAVGNERSEGAKPGAVKEFVMVGEFAELPSVIAKVTVNANGGMDPVPAVPIAQKELMLSSRPDVSFDF